MTVAGSGFGNGAKVVFVLEGEDVSTISTTTTWVDPTTLTADINIDPEAVIRADYEVAVEMRRGSRGVATERFSVREKTPGSNATLVPVRIEFGSSSAFTSDDAAYVNGDGGLLANINVNPDGVESGLFARVGPRSGNRRFLFQLDIVNANAPDLPPACVDDPMNPTVLSCGASVLQTHTYGFGPAFLDLTKGQTRTATFRAGWQDESNSQHHWWLYFGNDAGGKKACAVAEGTDVLVEATAPDNGPASAWTVSSANQTPSATLCLFDSSKPGWGLKWMADLAGPLEMFVCRLDDQDNCSAVP
jgi:hypothetical protein